MNDNNDDNTNRYTHDHQTSNHQAIDTVSDRVLLETITDTQAADLLTNPESFRHFVPFLAASQTVGDVAAATGEKANTVLARVRRYQRLGLVRVVQQKPRAGRAINVYRSSAESYFIPYEVTSQETLETALAIREAYWEGQLRKSVVRARKDHVGVWGTRIYKDAQGRPYVQAATQPHQNYTTLAPGAPAVFSAWRDGVYLDYDDAKALQREMLELIKTYQQKKGNQRYLIRLAMAPLQEG